MLLDIFSWIYVKSTVYRLQKIKTENDHGINDGGSAIANAAPVVDLKTEASDDESSSQTIGQCTVNVSPVPTPTVIYVVPNASIIIPIAGFILPISSDTH